MQLAHHVIYQARMREEEPAIGFSGGVVTYGLLAKGVEAAVEQLQQLNLSRQDLVAVHLSNPFYHSALRIALSLLGQPAASIFARAQIEFSGVTPAVTLTDSSNFELPGSRVVPLNADWFTVDPAKPADYSRLLSFKGFTSPDELVQVGFSSGTTGYPKAIAMRWSTVEKATLEGAILHAGPHSHAARGLAMTGVAGSVGLLMYALAHGGFFALATQPDEVLRLIRTLDLEVLFGSVGQLQSLLAALGTSQPPRSLRTIVGFGSKVPRSLLAEVRSRLCTNFNMLYASTEAGTMAVANGTLLERFEGCAGYVTPGISLETVDAADNPVLPGDEGIIRVKTPRQNHYLVPTDATDAMFREGWFYPGDIGRLAADGLLTITGRVSEVINRGGVIVAPEMIEEALRTYPGVKDVAVFGVPDKDGLDQIWAAVVSDNWVDEAAMRAVTFKRLPDRTPDRIVQVDVIPRTETSKVKRGELRQRFAPKPV